MNSSLLRACKARGRYIHVSKALKTIEFTLGAIKFKRTIIDPKKGVTRKVPERRPRARGA